MKAYSSVERRRYVFADQVGRYTSMVKSWVSFAKTTFISDISTSFLNFVSSFSNSKIKLVNDLLECIHLVASVEATFLGARAGLHPSILYDIISNAAGSSR